MTARPTPSISAKGSKFHDGTDFNAEDVKFSLDRARAEDSTNAQKGLFAAIESVEVVRSDVVQREPVIPCR